jgi:predicted glycogen debranching enzyme
VGRTLLVPKIDETVSYAGCVVPLAVNRWADGTVDPRGNVNIESFWLEGTAPVWRFAFADALLEKRVWMSHGANATFVRYELKRASSAANLSLRVFVDGRDHHGSTKAGDSEPVEIVAAPGGFRFGRSAATRGLVTCTNMGWTIDGVWYYGFDLARERERGLDAADDHLCAAHGTIELEQGQSCTLQLLADDVAAADFDEAWESFTQRERALTQGWRATAIGARAPDWIERLVVAADQFFVKCPAGTTVIAGYPWFTDWGRDTMIALPGLALATGRPEIAKSVLRTFASYVDRGMIPNRFPDAGGAPEYNTVDATLWYVIALGEYWAATGDEAFVRELFSTLAEIVDWHVRGTRFGIRCDPADGLLAAGEPGVQLTWMDAKVGDFVVTPRTGKPVEISALWYNALCVVARAADLFGAAREPYDRLANQARAGFSRYWNEERGYCRDVLDGPTGDDDAFRPNQIFAVSLPEPLLAVAQMRRVVDACGRMLLTSYGLRSLAPADPRYRGRYEGDPAARDGAYHQGTVWGWLLGPFALAHYRAYGDARRALGFLDPLEDALSGYGVGTLGEIFDGDPPHEPRGCIAQAWTVAQALRAWTTLRKESNE